MQIPFLNLAQSYETIRDELEQAVLRAMRSGHYILGREVAEFERNFAGFIGAGHAVGVASGTDAIELALRALGIGPGDDVLTVANVSAPTICAILAAGARPVLIDIDPATWNINPERIHDYLTAAGTDRARVKVILPVHLYGRCAEMQHIMAMAREFQLRVVEDASQAHGAHCGLGKAGTIGDIGCFSLYPTKNLGALGDAGVAVSNSTELAEKLRRLRNYGERARYENAELGRNSRLDEIQAALLSVKLKYLDQWNQRRRAIAEQFNNALAGHGFAVPGESLENLAGHVYHLYVVRSVDRDLFRDQLQNAGIGTAVHYPRPIHHQACFQGLCHVPAPLECTEEACRQVVSLPLFPELTDEQVNVICKAVLNTKRSESWNRLNTE